MTTKLIDKAVAGLRKAAAELEEFQLQLALGKAEATDKYEYIKAKLKKVISDSIIATKQKMRTSGLQAKLEELEVQLSLGKAETRDAFAEQRKRISILISEIENELEKVAKDSEFYIELKENLFKFSVMVELLRVHYELGKMEMRDELNEQRRIILKRIDEMVAANSGRKLTFARSWEHFHKEMDEVYDHLKKAFTL
jgi:hypothetical protein